MTWEGFNSHECPKPAPKAQDSAYWEEMYRNKLAQSVRLGAKHAEEIAALEAQLQTANKALEKIATHASMGTSGKREYEGDGYGFILSVARRALGKG